jgi:hypothetical protein
MHLHVQGWNVEYLQSVKVWKIDWLQEALASPERSYQKPFPIPFFFFSCPFNFWAIRK